MVVRNSHGCRIIQICFDLATREEKTRMVSHRQSSECFVKTRTCELRCTTRLEERFEGVRRKRWLVRFEDPTLRWQNKSSPRMLCCCLRVVCFETKMQIVGELIDGVKYLVFDQFANYVVQNALSVSREGARRFAAAIAVCTKNA